MDAKQKYIQNLKERVDNLLAQAKALDEQEAITPLRHMVNLWNDRLWLWFQYFQALDEYNEVMKSENKN